MSAVIDGFYERLLDKLLLCRNEELCCDFTIVVGDKSFKVHRQVVAACCKRIRTFIEDADGDVPNQIELDNIDPANFGIVLDLLYGSKEFELDETNVDGVLSTSVDIGFHVGIEECLEYYEKNLDTFNCIQALNSALEHNNAKLTELAALLFCDKFKYYMIGNEISKLSLKSLKFILTRDHVDIDSEADVLDAVLKWVISSRTERILYLTELLSSVRLSLVDDAKIEAYNSNPDCSGLVDKVKDAKTASGDQKVIPRLNMVDQQCIITFCPEPRWDTTVVEKYSFHNDTWTTVTRMPDARRFFSVVALGRYIYVIGGESCASKCLRSSLRYDVLKDEWLNDVADMNECRSNMAVATDNGLIYVLSGRTNSNVKNSAEVYDPDRNVWEFCPETNIRVDRGAAGVINGTIYLCGGVEQDVYENKYSPNKCIDSYNPLVGRWIRAGELSSVKIYAVCLVYNEKLLILGGIGQLVEPYVSEVFDPKTGKCSTWDEAFVGDAEPREGMVLFGDKLYTSGSFCDDNSRTRCLDAAELEVYDLKTKKWTKKSRPKSDRSVAMVLHSRLPRPGPSNSS